jgi:nucleolar MIF4G domain-containing protein 1
LQEVAVVILETCAQEDKFNKYYAFLADNLIKVQSNFKVSFQFALWDHFKLLDKYTLRKIANLAKFTSFLVTKRSFGLQILRSLDFEVLNKHQEIFMQVFLKDFLDKYTIKFIPYIPSIEEKSFKDNIRILNENENFALFRDQFRDYLKNKYYKRLKDGNVIRSNMIVYQ